MKIEGVSIAKIEKKEDSVVKTAVKPAVLRLAPNHHNGAVLAARDELRNVAETVRARLATAFKVAAANVAEPTLKGDEPAKKADEIIARHGGKDHLDTEAVGRELAELARNNPADAKLVADQIFAGDRLRDKDRDEVAQSFAQRLSDSDLKQLADSEPGRALLKKVDENLNQYPVHDDEAADSNRIRAELDKHGLFLGAASGMYPESVRAVSVADDPNASPEEVAAYVKLHPSSTNDPQTGRYAYLEALQAHQNDAQWLAKFHSALGSDKTAELISATLDPGTHWGPGVSGSDPELALKQVEVVRGALDTMAKAGVLTQESMDTLIGGMRENPYVATELFAKSGDQLKTLFINSAIKDGSDSWDAGALHVLNSMSPSAQQRILNGLGDKLTPFLQGAMAGQQEMISFSDTVKYGLYGSSMNKDELAKVTYGDVSKLLHTANEISYYNGYIPLPSLDSGLQNKIFNAVAQGLDKPGMIDKFKDNTAFEDELSEIFVRNHDQLFLDAQKSPPRPDPDHPGQFLPPINSGFINANFEHGLERFFQISLLTPPNGKQYENLSGTVFKMVNDGVTALSDPKLAQNDKGAFDAFVAKYHMEPAQYAKVLGGVLGSLTEATGYAQESINSDNAQREASIKFFTGLAFAMIPGAGGKIGEAVGENIFKHFVEEGASYFQDQLQDSIKEKIEKLLTSTTEGSDSDRAKALYDAVLGIFDAGLRLLPDGSTIGGDPNRHEEDFQRAFLDGFLKTSQYTRFDDASKN